MGGVPSHVMFKWVEVRATQVRPHQPWQTGPDLGLLVWSQFSAIYNTNADPEFETKKSTSVKDSTSSQF